MVGRRELLAGAFGATLLRATRAVAATRRATARTELGPFYRKSAPGRTQLRGDRDAGLALTLDGTVFDTRGDLVPDAVVEIWQADSVGRYDVAGDRFRAALKLDGKAGYSVDTVMPGHYPGRVCQHVHYLVRAPGHRPLVTQLYFATDPVFDGDPAKNFAKDPLITSVELVRPVSLTWKSAGEKTDSPVATLSLAWSSDGKTLALAMAGGTIVLADPALKVGKTFGPRGDVASDLAFVGDKLFARHRVQGQRSELACGRPTARRASSPASARSRGRASSRAPWLASATGDSVETWAP